ncbi:MAG: glutaredoxin 3 [Proteobacteria bacterium]|nr:glutaredoxin 3 [Pseudomonadota bacterium]
MAADIVMYTKDYCPYCTRAKALLEQLGQTYTEIDLVKHPTRKDEMVERAHGRTTVPQIFIDDAHVGGCDDLFALHAGGKLKPMLGL